MMNTWVSLGLPIAVALLTVAANAVVHIKIKFAPDADTAVNELKETFWRVLAWVFNVGVVVYLAAIVMSPSPVTRVSALQIAMAVGTLVFIGVIHVVGRMLHRIVDLQERQTGVLEKVVTVLDDDEEARAGADM